MRKLIRYLITVDHHIVNLHMRKHSEGVVIHIANCTSDVSDDDCAIDAHRRVSNFALVEENAVDRHFECHFLVVYLGDKSRRFIRSEHIRNIFR